MIRQGELELDTFQVRSGEIIISDPCYDEGTWCAQKVKAAKGCWGAEVEYEDGRVKRLEAYSKSILAIPLPDRKWQPRVINDQIGVDSGQCGFFDAACYRKNPIIKKPKHKWQIDGQGDFYGMACELTLGPMRCGLMTDKDNINFGVVSSSGYGDGGYVLTGTFNDKEEVVSLRLDFFGDESENDEPEED